MGGHSAEALRLGKQTLCQLSYSRSAYAQSKRLLEREGHSSGRRRLPQRSYLDATALVQRITTHSVCLLTCATPGANTSRRSSSNLLVRWKPATANSRYGGCQAFFRWCLEEEIIEHYPMARDEAPEGARLARPGPPPRRRREADRHVYASGSATPCAPRKIG